MIIPVMPRQERWVAGQPSGIGEGVVEVEEGAQRGESDAHEVKRVPDVAADFPSGQRHQAPAGMGQLVLHHIKPDGHAHNQLLPSRLA